MATDEEMRVEALGATHRWSVAVLLQADRITALHSALVPRRPVVMADKAQQMPFVHLGIEGRFCLVATVNLLRAREYLVEMTDASAVPGLPPSVARRAKILRDCFEHWNERNRRPSRNSGRAFDQFADLFDDEPDTHKWDSLDTYIGGVSLGELVRWAQEMDRFVDRLNESDFVWHGWVGP